MRRALIRLPANLWHSPRVERLAELMHRPKAVAIGCLIRFWGCCQTHGSERGAFLMFGTPAYLDRITDQKGFGLAMLEVGAIEPTDAGLKILWSNNSKLSPKITSQNLPIT